MIFVSVTFNYNKKEKENREFYTILSSVNVNFCMARHLAAIQIEFTKLQQFFFHKKNNLKKTLITFKLVEREKKVLIIEV